MATVLFCPQVYCEEKADPPRVAAAARPLPKVQFVLPTHAGIPHFQPGRQAPFLLEFRDTEFSNMKDMIERCHSEGILPDFTNIAPTLYIYMPNEKVYRQERLRLAAEARRQFQEVYPGVELNIKFRVPSTNINVTYLYNRVKDLLEDLKQRFAHDQEALEYLEEIERSAEQAFEDSKRALEVTAPTARKVKYSIAAGRFFVVAGARLNQMSMALAQGGAPAVAAIALIATDASVEAFNVVFQQKIQRMLSRWPFTSGFVNSALWNFILFSVGRPMLMQAFAHAAEADVPAPDMASAVNLLSWNSLGVIFYTLFTNGYNTLRDKGWVSASQIDMALQISGVFDLATGIINSNPNWYWYRIFTWGPQWTFYALVAAIARLAPIRRDRILAVEATIEDWRDIHEEQVGDASMHINTEADWQAALAKIRESEIKADAKDCETSLKRIPPPSDDEESSG